MDVPGVRQFDMEQQERCVSFSIDQKWPRLINLDIFRSIICQSSDEQLTTYAVELQSRYDTLNCSVRQAKKTRDQVRRAVSDNEQTLHLQRGKVHQLERNKNDKFKAGSYFDRLYQICVVKSSDRQPDPIKSGSPSKI